MTWLQIFGYISAALSILMVVPYIKDIFLLRTKPERASWLIWVALGAIAFASQWAKGATNSLWLSGGQLFSEIIVLALAIKYGIGGLTKRDVKALATAAIGLLLWYLTNEAAWALCIVIIIDAIGSTLTILKTYEDPGSETLSTWFMSGTSGIFGALAVGALNPILLVYPLYLVVANYAVVAVILLRRGLIKNHGIK